MKIYAVNISNINNILFNKLILFIDVEKRNKINRFIKDKDKIRALISEILVRNIICEEMNINNNDIIFIKNKFGKPFLRDFKNFNFNISHSGDWVVCAFDNKSIGIDIEKVQNINYEDLIQSCCTKEEAKFILEANLNERLSNFYKVWTLKESYIKADGRGLSLSLKSFSIKIHDNTNIKVSTDNQLKDCYFKQFDIDPKYKLSVCSVDKHISNNIIIIDQNSLLNNFI